MQERPELNETKDSAADSAFKLSRQEAEDKVAEMFAAAKTQYKYNKKKESRSESDYEADFEADVIQVITKPVGGMKLAQSLVYKTGEKASGLFAGIQSLCGDAFSKPYLEDGINFTLGCDGSRKAADIKDEEMAVGISKAKIEEVIAGLESI